MISRATTLPCLLIVVACSGCGELSSYGNAPSTSESVDRVLAAAARYLELRQSPDGAWRSDVYGPFKEGDALTPLVLTTLVELPQLPDDHHRLTAIASAKQYLIAMVDENRSVRPSQYGLAYPIYTAAGAVIALSRETDPKSALKARDAWLAYLRERQLSEALGWQPDDARYGGWGYSPDLPRKPTGEQPLGNLAEPNLSATVFALEALRAAGVAADDPAVQKALRFVRRCQNFDNEFSEVGERFDDGGFFFVQDDPVRNKAGVAGIDRAGRVRFVSYGSATADGLRAFELCGVSPDDPRAAAAWAWLERHFAADAHPGAYPADREGARPAVFFYYCNSLAKALGEAGFDNPIARANKAAWARAIADALAERQRPDGSWKNAAVDVREDDPLVATSLAASALARCRAMIGD